ncbi:acylneuraminate cytidylyltransferase family protein [Aestuariibaculum lutulentum]|uniref:Acylneuraminate cytidylyltransferase family protein n=1 Tax=Aestuariibaculum lutulentum TaxID=2920935 RepID=A0ABS9RE64_9FLAO|nr:acylneuraminate cytidylyltransferase family protein [Aestuariibaculum lutulentum]MCH4551230.1 acylneuraminate cytidylyltransferase family protein [Aestuariibaculum lutulentum]
MKVLGIIPARGGSKGIPDKNKKNLAGKPLMQYTIEAALKSKLLDDVIFSSEDKTLMEMAKMLGVQVPFVRPSELATDTAGTIEVVKHSLKALSKIGKHYDAVCLLQVTNPFRTSAFIDEAILEFTKSKKDALVSVLKVPHQFNPHWVFEVNENGGLKIATGDEQIIKRRQELPTAYYRDGSIYLVKTSVVLNQNSLYGETTAFIEANPEWHVNIDTMEDWKKAEDFIRRKQSNSKT